MTYIPERDCFRRRRWHGDTNACREFHANRRRIRGNLACMTLRGMDNVAKRYLMHSAGYNRGQVMHHLSGTAPPERWLACLFIYFGLWGALYCSS